MHCINEIIRTTFYFTLAPQKESSPVRFLMNCHLFLTHLLLYFDGSHISEISSSECSTSGAGGFRRAVGRPGRLFPPPHAGGGGNAEQVDGVRLQVLQEMLRFLSRQLHL